MKKTRIASRALFVVMCGLWGGCDDLSSSDPSSPDPQATHEALSSSQTEEALLNPPDVIPSGPVKLEWTTLSKPVSEGVKSLELRVTNNLPVPVAIVPELETVGFDERESHLALGAGKQTLDVEESTLLSVDVRDLPFQNRVGLSRLSARVRVRAKGDDREFPVTTPHRFYRFDDRYATISTFDERTAIEKHGGVLFDTTDTETASAEIGRMVDAEGLTSTVRQQDMATSIKADEGGEGEFLVTGSGMGLVYMDDIAPRGGAK